MHSLMPENYASLKWMWEEGQIKLLSFPDCRQPRLDQFTQIEIQQNSVKFPNIQVVHITATH